MIPLKINTNCVHVCECMSMKKNVDMAQKANISYLKVMRLHRQERESIDFFCTYKFLRGLQVC